MRILNLGKYGVMSRYMGIDPKAEAENFVIGPDHKTLIVGVKEVRASSDSSYSLVPTAVPAPGRMGAVFVELNPEILNYGRVISQPLLIEKDTLDIRFVPSKKNDELQVANIAWLAKYRVTELSK